MVAAPVQARCPSFPDSWEEKAARVMGQGKCSPFFPKFMDIYSVARQTKPS